MTETKPTVAVLFGGCSSEHDVSLHSAQAVLSNLDAERYRVVPVGIDRAGAWFVYEGPADALEHDAWRDVPNLVPVAPAFDRGAHGLVSLTDGAIIALDAALPILHGRNGEDGSVQGALGLAGVPVVGCDIAGSAICMDKVLSHRIAEAAGVAVAAHALVRAADGADAARAAAKRVGYPLFVKPPCEGSSMGVSRVASPDRLDEALRLAFAYADEALVEREIVGCEIGCAVLEDAGALLVGELDEVVLNGSLFDYHEKYSCETAEIVVPARVSPQQKASIVDAAKRLLRALACVGFARIDFFLAHDGTLYFNEANTVPGFTEHSRFPAMFAAAGLPLDALLSTAVDQAVGR